MTKKKTGIPRLLEISGQRPFKLIVASLLALVSTLCELAPFVIIYRISLNLLSPNIDLGLIIYLAKLGVGFTVVRMISLYISVVVSHIAAYEILYGIRKQLAEKLGRLPLGFFTQNTQGAVKGILNEDVERIEIFIAHRIPDLTSAVVSPVLAFLYLCTISVRMGLVLLIPMAIVVYSMSRTYMNSSREKLFGDWMRALERMNGTIVEYVRGMPVVKVFNQTAESFTRFRDAVKGYTDNTVGWSEQTVHWWGVAVVFMTSGLSIILPFGVWFYSKGVLPLSAMILFLFLGVQYLIPLIKLTNFIGYLSMVTEGVVKIDNILDTPEIPEATAPKTPSDYSVEFKNVDFSYGETQVLHDVNIQFKEGTVNALIGPSGAGKSTIAHLILRFWDVDSGEILIGGVNVKDIPYEKHMDLVSFVFQDVFILSDTVHENIAMGKSATREQVIEAAKAAQIHDYVMLLPDGYETKIGEGGVHMSGGEKQRVSVARSILKDSPIIVLDEATAYADAENESKIQEAFGELMHGKTVIIIAHRLSTITNSDQIVVIDEGRVNDTGTHQELVDSPLYGNLWNAHMMTHSWYFGKGGDE